MSKPIHIEVVSQSKEGSIIMLCHLDKEGIAFHSSNAAQIIFQNNKKLFDSINSKTKFIGGIIYRTVASSRDIDFSSVMSLKQTSKDYKETELANVSMFNGEIVPFVRIKNQKGTQIDVDMNNLRPEDEKGPESNRRLSRTDVEKSQKISEILPLRLFHKDSSSVTTFACRDHFSANDMGSHYSYRMKIAVVSDFDEYIDFVLNKVEESISFLNRYLSSISRSNSYVNGRFKTSFSKRILESIGINFDSEERVFLNDPLILNSDFGELALNLYNGLLLFNADQPADIYGTTIKNILPFKSTSIENIFSVKESLYSLQNQIINVFDKKKRSFKKAVYPGKTNKKIKIIESDRSALYSLQRHVHGYYIFKPVPDPQYGMATGPETSLTTEEYMRRFVEEQAKFYPTIDPGPDADFMTKKQRNDFISGNRVTYITPERMVMGDRHMDIDRGVANIDDKFVFDFKILKAAIAERKSRSSIDKPYSPTSNSLASLGISIGEAKPSLNEKATVEIVDPFIDANKYLGQQSTFLLTKILFHKKDIDSFVTKEEDTAKKILTPIATRRYLHRPNKSKSIKNIELSNPNSNTRVAIQKKVLDLTTIPPQIKNLTTKGFRSNESIDPIAVTSTATVIEETQSNVYSMVKLNGFERNSDNKINLSAPKYEKVTEEDMILGGILVKAIEYENPELGILKDNYSGTIYDNLTYIRRKDGV
tara:strand:- start:206 stop:2326 length:2121 start_codon:yes stop_codon:yes gene_type:complete